MKILISILLTYFAFTTCLVNAGTAGKIATNETIYLVDMPTAGVLPENSFYIRGRIYNAGGMLLDVNYVPITDLIIGLSYSGEHIIGDGTPTLQKYPGLHIRYRFINETEILPAFAIGFTNQGSGNYDKGTNRFSVFSPGFFLALSKSFEWDLGALFVHGGLNFSFDPIPQQRVPNMYLGFEQNILERFAVNMEYNLTIDDGDARYISGKGLINTSIRASLNKNVTFAIEFRDLLQHRRDITRFGRFVKLEYVID